jgi:hypothetical protein
MNKARIPKVLRIIVWRFFSKEFLNPLRELFTSKSFVIDQLTEVYPTMSKFRSLYATEKIPPAVVPAITVTNI